MPVLPPNPPLGGIRCAASPARNTRPSRNLRATSEVGRQRATPSILTGKSGMPAPARTNSISRASLMSAGIGRGFRILLRIADGVHRQKARQAILVHPEEAAEHGIVDVHDAQLLVE